MKETDRQWSVHLRIHHHPSIAACYWLLLLSNARSLMVVRVIYCNCKIYVQQLYFPCLCRSLFCCITSWRRRSKRRRWIGYLVAQCVSLWRSAFCSFWWRNKITLVHLLNEFDGQLRCSLEWNATVFKTPFGSPGGGELCMDGDSEEEDTRMILNNTGSCCCGTRTW